MDSSSKRLQQKSVTGKVLKLDKRTHRKKQIYFFLFQYYLNNLAMLTKKCRDSIRQKSDGNFEGQKLRFFIRMILRPHWRLRHIL